MRFLEFSYDGFGRRERTVDQSGFTTAYAYDAAGRLWHVREGAGNAIVTYASDAAGRLKRVDKGNQTYTTFDYDAAGQLTHLVNFKGDGTVNSRFDYVDEQGRGYDALGRSTYMKTLDGVWTYGYDATGQLTDADFAPARGSTVPAQDLHYDYDALGNRTRTLLNGVETIHTPNKLNQYSSAGGVTRQYDPDGNLTFDGTNT